MSNSPGSHTIQVFPYQTSWRYSDGDPLTGASNASWVGRNRDSEPIPSSMACCEREVQYTQPQQTSEVMTLVAGERRSLFFTGDDDEVYDKKP